MVGGVLSQYADISRRNRRYFRYVTPEAVTLTFRSTKRKFLPSLWVFGSMKGFETITGAAGSVTFMSGGTNILLSLPSLFYLSLFLNFERTSEQNIAFRTIKGIAEKRRIQQSPNKSNRANNNRTSKPAWLKALQTLFACSVDFQLQRDHLSQREKEFLIEHLYHK